MVRSKATTILLHIRILGFSSRLNFQARSSFQALRLEKEKVATREIADVSGNDADQRKDPRRRNSKVRSTPRVSSGPSESSSSPE